MSGDSLLGLTRVEIIETERSPIALRAGLIIERAREGRRKEPTHRSVFVGGVEERWHGIDPHNWQESESVCGCLD